MIHAGENFPYALMLDRSVGREGGAGGEVEYVSRAQAEVACFCSLELIGVGEGIQQSPTNN